MGIFSVRKTTEEFSYSLSLIYPNLILIGEYKNNKTKIVISDEFGIMYLVSPKNLLRGAYPSFMSAIDKNEWFIKKAKFIHKNRYDYSRSFVCGIKAKTNIICKNHGEFSQTVADHLNGSDCPKCANDKRGWTYTKWINASLESKKFESYKVYIVKCWDDNEEFYKIGKTFVPMKQRLGIGMTKAFPYYWEPIKLIISDGKSICKIERNLQSINNKDKYVPAKSFSGDTECFSSYKLSKYKNYDS